MTPTAFDNLERIESLDGTVERVEPDSCHRLASDTRLYSYPGFGVFPHWSGLLIDGKAERH